jgi:aminoglycoside/choline kinase family phosphotransferase
MDERAIRWDLNYFKYCFLKGTGIEFSEPKLEDDFDTLVKVILAQPANAFLYRDCQSRNIMIKDGQPYFIDFQGGRRGPTQYDVVSLLWQAKAHLSPALREQLIAEYLDELEKIEITNHQSPITNRASWLSALPHFVLLRTLQVLGAYGYRGYFERKQHFLESIPLALKNLKELFAEHSELRTQYPYLYAISNDLLILV